MKPTSEKIGSCIMTLPRCASHGEMVLRPVRRQTAEQRFCGVWYDCPRCSSSTLFTSPALESHLAKMKGGA